jgi:aminoglycoside/choline kinase family phosphotransferase
LQAGLNAESLPAFDKPKLLSEMRLFSEWFCGGLLALELDAGAREVVENAFDFLADAALTQPQCAVHRDYHSRNLMLLDDGELGVIDFQDAVRGAYTYDLVSLLRDCYICWPRALVEEWSRFFYERRADASLAVSQRGYASFRRDFDLMGLQRHLKVMGIFSRLHLRDNKSDYLADIPLVMDYFLSVARLHPELKDMVVLFENAVLPRAEKQLQALISDASGT